MREKVSVSLPDSATVRTYDWLTFNESHVEVLEMLNDLGTSLKDPVDVGYLIKLILENNFRSRC